MPLAFLCVLCVFVVNPSWAEKKYTLKPDSPEEKALFQARTEPDLARRLALLDDFVQKFPASAGAQSHGVRAIAVPVDLSAREAVEPLIGRAEQEFGRVDLLINNAGIMHVEDYAVLDPDSIDQTIRLNLRAPMLLVQ